MPAAKKTPRKRAAKKTSKKTSSKASRSLSKREPRDIGATDLNRVTPGLKSFLDAIEPDLLDAMPSDTLEEKLRRGEVQKARCNQKYTKHNLLIALKIIALGGSQRSAASLVGISEQEFSDWKKDHPEFSEAVDRAKSLRETSLVHMLWGGMEKNPRLALDALERLHPDTWAPVKRHEHSGNVDVSHKAVKYLDQLESEWVLPDEPSSGELEAPSEKNTGTQQVMEAEVIEESPLPTETDHKSTETGGNHAAE